MTIKDIFKKCIKQRQYTQSKLAEKIGAKGQSTIAMYFKKDNSITLNNALKVFDALDYDIVIRSRLTDKDEWIVDDKPEPMPKKMSKGALVTSDGYVLTQNDIDMMMEIVNKMKGEAK